MQGKKNYQEKLFISFQLSDHIPTDNFYKRLNDTLDFVYRATAKYYGREGQKSIDPVVFMKLMLVGYLENLSSDRKIISTSRMRMDIMFFLGYDLDEGLPWHSTLSRTRQLYGMELFENLFKQYSSFVLIREWFLESDRRLIAPISMPMHLWIVW
jgi:transposase